MKTLFTGNADVTHKFKVWAETVPYTMRNPALPLDAHGTYESPSVSLYNCINGDSAARVYGGCGGGGGGGGKPLTTQTLLLRI